MVDKILKDQPSKLIVFVDLEDVQTAHKVSKSVCNAIYNLPWIIQKKISNADSSSDEGESDNDSDSVCFFFFEHCPKIF